MFSPEFSLICWILIYPREWMSWCPLFDNGSLFIFSKKISPQVYFGTYCEQKWDVINIILYDQDDWGFTIEEKGMVDYSYLSSSVMPMCDISSLNLGTKKIYLADLMVRSCPPHIRCSIQTSALQFLERVAVKDSVFCPQTSHFQTYICTPIPGNKGFTDALFSTLTQYLSIPSLSAPRPPPPPPPLSLSPWDHKEIKALFSGILGPEMITPVCTASTWPHLVPFHGKKTELWGARASFCLLLVLSQWMKSWLELGLVSYLITLTPACLKILIKSLSFFFFWNRINENCNLGFYCIL